MPGFKEKQPHVFLNLYTSYRMGTNLCTNSRWCDSLLNNVRNSKILHSLFTETFSFQDICHHEMGQLISNKCHLSRRENAVLGVLQPHSAQ
jgi:hypothetical protein